MEVDGSWVSLHCGRDCDFAFERNELGLTILRRPNSFEGRQCCAYPGAGVKEAFEEQKERT